MAQGRFIGYVRVSTDKQGRSGLGLEAQRQAIESYLNGGDWQLLDTFVEVESGSKSDRPQLRAALEACRRTGARLIIAKLDRLSRNLAFIANLMEAGVGFVAADMPHANEFTVHVLAAVAQHERKMISQRTKEALRVAKARGVKLGNPQGLRPEVAAQARQRGTEVACRKAETFAARLYPHVARYRDLGLSLNEVARRLNIEGVLGPRGRPGTWTATSVRNLLRRVEAEPR